MTTNNSPQTIEGTAAFWALAFVPEIPCEGEQHETGTGGHVQSELAAYLLCCPSCRTEIAQCHGRVDVILTQQLIHCPFCGTDTPTLHFRITPIN